MYNNIKELLYSNGNKSFICMSYMVQQINIENQPVVRTFLIVQQFLNIILCI